MWLFLTSTANGVPGAYIYNNTYTCTLYNRVDGGVRPDCSVYSGLASAYV